MEGVVGEMVKGSSGVPVPSAHVCGGQNKIMNNSQFKLCDV